MSRPFENQTYFALALDPIYVGTGGYRLGRVDLSIVREPGTNLPKIPGTSISGVARAYTAMNYSDKFQRISKDEKGNPIVKKDQNGNPVIDKWGKPVYEYESCAGKGGIGGEKHCGCAQPACPVCIPFGFSKAGNSFQGLAQFGDARILFFPVYSLMGPIWITTSEILEEIGVKGIPSIDNKKFIPLNIKFNQNYYSSDTTGKQRLNFGWLMLPSQNINGAEIDFSNNGEFKKIAPKLKFILQRLVLLPMNLFTHVVNTNLEVRTSVSIDPATGAAEEGALFTYEAIPRSTVFWFTVVYNDPRNFRIEGKEIKKEDGSLADIDWVKQNVEKGFSYFKYLGIGGMGTRGMGRLWILNNSEVE